jgi:hypothetical protein
MRAAAGLLVVQGLLTAALATRLEGTLAVGFSAGGAVQAAIGLALFSGRTFVRSLALAALGGASAALLVAMAVVPTLWPSLAEPVWIPALLAVLPLAAIFGILVSETMSRGRVVATAAAIATGWGGYALGAYRAAPGVDPRLARLAADWAAPERQIVRADLGVTIHLPDGWISLRDGHPIEQARDAVLVLAETQTGAFATLRVALHRRSISLDGDLDDVARAQQESLASVREDRRLDARVGAAPARRLLASWSASGRSRRAAITVWRDGPRVLQLAVVVPKRSGWEQDLERIHAAIGFRGVIEAEVLARSNDFAAECPVFDPSTTRALAREAWPETSRASLFRTGYAAAIRGQTRLSSAEVEAIRSAMAPLYARLREEQRVALGEYVELLRKATPTSPDANARMADVVCASARDLNREQRAALGVALARAAQVGLE